MGYGAVIDDLYISIGSDSTNANGNIISTIRYNPYYVSMKISMNIGDSYSYTYTSTALQS